MKKKIKLHMGAEIVFSTEENELPVRITVIDVAGNQASHLVLNNDELGELFLAVTNILEEDHRWGATPRRKKFKEGLEKGYKSMAEVLKNLPND